MRYNNVTIKGTGSYLPEDILTNKDIEKNCDTTDDWIIKNLGIEERRIVKNETVSDLGTKAAKQAIMNANLSIEEIDMIIVATSSPERISPSTACMIHKKLGIKKNIPCFDINAVCAGFLFGMGIAAPLISSKAYKNILVIGTETYSKITDYKHRNCVFFGDGAGALILSESKSGWLFMELNSNGSGTGDTGFTCHLNSKYTTIPKQVKDQACKVLPISINRVLKETNTNVKDIDIFIPHQASINILKNIAEQVGLKTSKIKAVMSKFGNIAGASLPIAFHDAVMKDEIKKNTKVLFSAIGSGWSWGTILLHYDD